MYCKSRRLFIREIMPNSVTMYTKNSTFYLKECLSLLIILLVILLLILACHFLKILQYNCTMNTN